MFIDTLTIAGLLSASSFLLMPLLMGREFIRVEIGEEAEPRARKMKTDVKRAPQPTPLELN